MRKSILTKNLKQCYVCKYPVVDINEIYEGAKRQRSIQNDFCIPLCRKHHIEFHNNREFALYFKKICQQKYEETHTREEFINIIKKNYL